MSEARFGTEGVSTQQTSKYFGRGVHYLKINSLAIETASTGTPRVVFNMETEPIEEEGFEPDEEATVGGQVGRVRTIYMKHDNQLQEFNSNIAQIANKLGVRSETDKIAADSLEEYVEALNDVITDKYAWFGIKGEQYYKNDGKPGVALLFRRYGFVASETEGEDALEAHDDSNEYHFKKAEPPQTEDVVTQSAEPGGTEGKYY